MIIVWKGHGIAIPIIVAVVMPAFVYSVEAIMKDDNYCRTHYWPKFLALVISAGIVWFVGRRLNKAVQVKDAAGLENKKFKNYRTHSLYSLDFEYWAFVILALAACGYLF